MSGSGSRGRPARARAPRKPCRGCGASLEGTHIRRVWCMACLATRTNRACAARLLALTRSRGARPRRRVVEHSGERACKACRRTFHATWHTRYPLFCPTCRGRRIVALGRKRHKEWHERNRGR